MTTHRCMHVIQRLKKLLKISLSFTCCSQLTPFKSSLFFSVFTNDLLASQGSSPLLSPLLEAQKKQLEESIELIQDECVSENADHSTEEPAEGGQEADGGEMTDGVEEDFDEDGGHELVGMRHLDVSTSVG